ncbi:hypothetical protein EKO27_g8059 [Xylaria grammica]|uniref:Stress-response A/B barrel domain-containing protein n=1 Tax=Xylaria grammica TaxID=363999 RepID=A0A439CY45_9PEZI|nr:stress responsive A/B barrel domain-containing protein [Xylaria grammica]RWA07036.1 hypothetical protein EKO27_g8059 [Xylaria grammica]GAW19524.1 hypothetical protein ANO14919_090120 [Xylariales sp. No.14919]
MPINHLVLFQFKDGASTETIDETYADMLSLKDNCIRDGTQKPYIQSLTGGKDNSPEGLQNGIQYAFVVQFANEDDRNYYALEDKAHKAFIAKHLPNLGKAIVVDYSF